MPHKRSQETEARHRAAYEEKKKQMETCASHPPELTDLAENYTSKINASANH
ncbi:hypothetical protein Pmar_PMAR027636 [Perkinsus marinus ATCC 50983]|uniref:Uncharacterized protein n=1 Tax=Perkinsus marinus (strain ATCC 50983 / TXsc) TaxID=423536 RepID=C5KCA7_PERM5|nr:hypothetical protein Pmar_PMAR027636 [Perkinsus marinus ATCC 50983]EER17920.1 hypothetical protein Pmar_PMAR027636 [Perkinsus marinus ATCC 50983]|eukprot:XP_002786124.1 hypothetical protein Pmar_PMAR027636 [Perkinsus marinus ATCC 50983]